MDYTLNLYSSNQECISKFLKSFYEKDKNILGWEISSHLSNKENKNPVYVYTKRTTNPVDFVVLLGALADNNNIKAWLSLDKDAFINITHNNIDLIIKYIYERFPY